MKIEHVLFPSVFFKITDPFDGRSFLMCSHDPFFGTNKNRILKNEVKNPDHSNEVKSLGDRISFSNKADFAISWCLLFSDVTQTRCSLCEHIMKF